MYGPSATFSLNQAGDLSPTISPGKNEIRALHMNSLRRALLECFEEIGIKNVIREAYFPTQEAVQDFSIAAGINSILRRVALSEGILLQPDSMPRHRRRMLSLVVPGPPIRTDGRPDSTMRCID